MSRQSRFMLEKICSSYCRRKQQRTMQKVLKLTMISDSNINSHLSEDIIIQVKILIMTDRVKNKEYVLTSLFRPNRRTT